MKIIKNLKLKFEELKRRERKNVLQQKEVSATREKKEREKNLKNLLNRKKKNT